MAALAPAQLNRLRTATVRPASLTQRISAERMTGYFAEAASCAGGASAGESLQAASGVPLSTSNMPQHDSISFNFHISWVLVHAVWTSDPVYCAWPIEICH